MAAIFSFEILGDQKSKKKKNCENVTEDVLRNMSVCLNLHFRPKIGGGLNSNLHQMRVRSGRAALRQFSVRRHSETH